MAQTLCEHATPGIPGEGRPEGQWQALTFAAVLADVEPHAIEAPQASREALARMRECLRPLRARLPERLDEHPEVREVFELRQTLATRRLERYSIRHRNHGRGLIFKSSAEVALRPEGL